MRHVVAHWEFYALTGLVLWVLSGLIAVVGAIRMQSAQRKRRLTLLPCDWEYCWQAADVVYVGDDTVRGLCDMHFEREHEQEMPRAGDERTEDDAA